jgi:hypothetical protein
VAVRVEDWYIDQGADFLRTNVVSDPVTGLPINLSAGWTAKAQIRPSTDSATLLHELTSAGGTITLGADGKVTFKIAGAVSLAWTWIDVSAKYDCLLTGPVGQLIRILQGDVFVSPDTTR